MPIMFENRLGNSKSDRRLRKIYKAHQRLWQLYYGVIIIASGTAIAIAARSNLFFSLSIIVLTLVVLALLFVCWPRPRRR